LTHKIVLTRKVVLTQKMVLTKKIVSTQKFWLKLCFDSKSIKPFLRTDPMMKESITRPHYPFTTKQKAKVAAAAETTAAIKTWPCSARRRSVVDRLLATYALMSLTVLL
jgi:hypothetical protein